MAYILSPDTTTPKEVVCYRQNSVVPVIQVVPIIEWSAKKARIQTNVGLYPSSDNGLSKTSIADCLQTRPIDHCHGLVRMRGQLSIDKVQEINQSLKILFELCS